MLRLCIIRVEGMFSTNKEALQGVTNIKPRLEGGLGRPANYFLDSFWFENMRPPIDGTLIPKWILVITE